MSDYIYHLKNGQTMTVSGETMPSDDEVESLAKQNGVELMPADNTSTPAPVKTQSIDISPTKLTTQPSSQLESSPDRRDTPDWYRDDGTQKGNGFYGLQKLTSGKVASEYSVAESEKLKDDKGNYIDYPTMIPGLTKDEFDAVLRSASDDTKKTPLPDSVYQKAEAFALARKAKGLPLFATKDEEGKTPIPSAEKGMLGKAWDFASKPLTELPTHVAKLVSDYITQPSADTEDNLMTRAKGFGAGAIEGLGNVASGLTSPINLATTVATGGSSLAGKAGLTGIADALSLGARGLSAPMAAEGAYHTFAPSSTLSERAQGIAEMAGGIAGIRHVPNAEIPSDLLEAPVTESTTQPIKGAMPISKGAKLGTENGISYTDKYAKFREVPVGTKYAVSPDSKLPMTVKEAMNLGFEYKGVNDAGKIVIEKTKESPNIKFPNAEPDPANTALDLLNVPRTIMASEDFSAPLRQGLGLIHKKQFWTALPDMFKAFGTEDAYNATQQAIADKPLFRKTISSDGTIKPSFAEQAGVKLTDLNNMSSREESIMSKIAEKVPGIRRSERAYTAFLNKVRADVFEQMTTDFGVFSGENPKANLGLATQIADFVNAASGRGKLSVTLGKHTYSAEPAAKALSSVLFSPRLMASRLQMMGQGARAVFSPEVYMLSQPSIRREYLKSLFAIAAVGNTFTQLGRLAGGTVESDPASSDFGKLKIGNTRIDPYGGFQQIITLAQRMMPEVDLSSMGLGKIGGEMKSTTTGVKYDLANPHFGQSNRADVLSRFIRSKTNPIINFGWGLAAGQKELSGQPMNFTTMNPMNNSIAQRFLPMLSQDIYDLIQDQKTPVPAKIAAGAAATFGMGSQTYTGKSSTGFKRF